MVLICSSLITVGSLVSLPMYLAFGYPLLWSACSNLEGISRNYVWEPKNLISLTGNFHQYRFQGLFIDEPHNWKIGKRSELKGNIFSSNDPGITYTPTYTNTRNAYICASPKTYTHGDFPGGSVVKTLPSNARGAGSIPSWGAKTPHASWPKNQNIKQKQYYDKFNKDFKNGPHKKNLKKIYIHILIFTAALFIIAKNRKQLKCP